MFWVALASAIMVMSGEGDDSRAYYRFHNAITAAVRQVIPDSKRVRKTLVPLRRAERRFRAYRFRMARAGSCLEQVDRTYAATREDYMACTKGRDRRWQILVDFMTGLDNGIQGSASDDEWKTILALAQRKLNTQP